MSLASEQAAIDSALSTLLSDIDVAQATYLAANGKYWQGRLSHNTIPADGNTVAANNITGVYPTDQPTTWATFGVTPGTIPAAVQVDAYQSGFGHGYKKKIVFIHLGGFYSRFVYSGNTQENNQGWDTVADVDVPVSIPAPTYTSLSVATGPAAGGTSTTITGTGFQSGATVTFGGAAATSVIVVSATSITCVTPSGTAGARDVVITNIDAQAVTGTNAFTYASAALAIVQSDRQSGTDGGGLTFALATPTSGNLLVMGLASSKVSSSLIGNAWVMSGWTEVQSGYSGFQVFYKISNGTETAPNPDDSGIAGFTQAGVCFEISGNHATPIDVSAASNATRTTPSVTTTVANCMVLTIGCTIDTSLDYETVPSTWTLIKRQPASGGTNEPAVNTAYKMFASAGATGTANFDVGDYATAKVFTIAIKPV